MTVQAQQHKDAQGQSAAWQGCDERKRKQFWATLALRHTQGLGSRSVARLLQQYGSAYAAVQAAARWRHELGLRESVVAAFRSGSWRVTAEQEWRRAQSLEAHLVLWHEALFPEALRQLPDAPALLYCRGNIHLLSGSLVGMVGSRHCSMQGLRMCARMARELAASGLTVVSGMARGIDSAAHSAALAEVGSSIGVLGTGIDCVYPPANAGLHTSMARQGLLVSEFAPDTQARPENFPIRNRIISGLSLGVVIVEAAFKSGSLITARLALEQNREVYIVPAADQQHFFSEGCRALELEGAQVVSSAEHIVHDLVPRLAASLSPSPAAAPPCDSAQNKRVCPAPHEAPSSPARPQPKPAKPAVPKPDLSALPALSQALCHALKAQPECTVDALCEAVQCGAGQVNAQLILLEMEGYVCRLPGGRYTVGARLC